MRIFKQINQYDCGISVTQALINHYYHKVVSKEQLMTEANITNQGLSILDLEQINHNYGINLTTYDVAYEEFVPHQTKDYFILMLQFDFGNHYVIAKKNQQGVLLYDSWLGRRFISYQELKKYYSQVYIEINLANYHEKWRLIKKHKIIANYWLLAIVFSINVLLLGLNVLAGYFLKTIFNDVIGSHDLTNLTTIIFVAVFGYLSIGCGSFFISVLQTKQKYHYHKQLTKTMTIVLGQKSNNFFTKIVPDQFVLLDWHIENIAKYYTKYYHNLFIYCFNIVWLVIFLALINIQILIIVLLSLIIQVGYNYLVYCYNKWHFPKIKQLSETNKRIYFQIEQFLKNEIHVQKFQTLLFRLKHNVFQNSQLSYQVDLSNIGIEKLNILVNSLINLALNCLGAYLLLKDQLSYGTLIMGLNLFNYLTYSTNQVIDFSFFRIDFRFSGQIYLSFLNIANHQENGQQWRLPKTISCQQLTFFHDQKLVFDNYNLVIRPSTFLFGPSGAGKSSLYKLIAKQWTPSQGLIYFDQIPTSSFQDKALTDHIIYQKNLPYLPPNLVLSKLTTNFSSSLLQLTKEISQQINLNWHQQLESEKLSSGQHQFINILLLYQVKNKLIILDEATSHLDQEVRQKIYCHFIVPLMNNNFVICSEHDHLVKQYFPHTIHLTKTNYEQINC